MNYKVKLSYGAEFIFDNIEEAGTFFNQALRHAVDRYDYSDIEPIYPTADDGEEVSDD